MVGLLFSLILIVPVFGIDNSCLWKDIEKIEMNQSSLILSDSNIAFAQPLEFRDFNNGTGGNLSKASFIIYNPNPYDFIVHLSYNVNFKTPYETDYGIKVPAKNFAKVEHLCYDLTNWLQCFIDPDSVKYYITSPRLLYLKNITVVKDIIICKKSCEQDSDCGTGICSISGYCHTSRIAPCDGIQRNCDDKACLNPSSLEIGLNYMCEWECKSGTGKDGICKFKDGESCQNNADCVSNVCNLANRCGEFKNIYCDDTTVPCNNERCVKPSSKGSGEKYYCVEECKSQRGDNNICNEELIIIWIRYSIFGVLIIIGGYFIWRKTFKKDITQLEKIRQIQEKELFTTNLKLANLLGQINKESEEKGKRIKQDYEREILRKKEIIKLLANTIEEIKVNLDKTRNDFNEKQKELDNRKKEQEKVEKEIIEREEKNTKSLENINREDRKIEKQLDELRKKRLKPYKNAQGYQVYRNESDREVLEHNNRLFHIWWYEKNSGDSVNISLWNVHHIDGDHLNNEYWNLIKIDKEKHLKKIHKLHKPWMSYKRGVEILIDENIELPKRIGHHLKNLEDDKS